MDGAWEHLRSARRCAALVGCIAALAVVVPATASAEIVFDRGPDIYAANDDGSGAHVLVTAAQLGMDYLDSPALSPDGTALLFDGTTLRNKGCSHTCAYGANAIGAYVLQDGRVTRLSGAAAPYDPSGPPSTTADIAPEPTSDGRYAYQYEQCAQYYDSMAQTWSTGCANQLATSSVSGGAAAATPFASECDDDTAASAALGDPSPDPVDPDRIAYVGCRTPYNPLRTQKGEIIVAGPGDQDPVVVATGADGTGFQDPSWSPDGSRLIAYAEGGNIDDLDTGYQADVTPGLYLYDPSNGLDPTQSNGPGTLLLSGMTDANGDPMPYTSPRFIGSDRIAFAVGGSVFSIPVSCRDDCDADLLYQGDTDAYTQATGVAWTDRTIGPATVLPPLPGGGNGGGTGGGTGGGNGDGNNGPAPKPIPPKPTPLPDTTAPGVKHLRLSPHRVRSGRSVTLHFTLSEPATVAVELQRATTGRRRRHRCVRATRALRHHARCTRWAAFAHTKRRPMAAGTQSIHLGRRIGHHVLRAGHYRILLSAVDAAGNHAHVRRTTLAVIARRHKKKS